jgi:hypothetical protein
MLDESRRLADPLVPIPFDDEEAELCRRVGSRLASELRSLLRAMPDSARTVRGLAAHLGVDRNICQRVVAATKEQEESEQVLVRAPGVRGLRAFLHAAGDHGVDDSLTAAAAAAVEAFEELTSKLAGSQTRLIARIHAAGDRVGGGLPEAAVEDARRQRHLADIKLMGLSCETRVVLDILRPMPDDERLFEHANVGGWAGVRTFSKGVPFVTFRGVSSETPTESRVMNFDYEPITGNSSGFLLEEFSSSPPPQITTRGSGNSVLEIIDVPLAGGSSPLDFFTGRLVSPAGPHPAYHSDERSLIRNVMARYPTQRLFLDIYLHRSMASASLPFVGCYMQSLYAGPIKDRWYDRMPHSPKLEVLGLGLDRAGSEWHPRQAALTRHVFDRLDWPAGEFVGYRCEVSYPLSSTDYAMWFEFEAPPHSPSSTSSCANPG